jgi:hypothetical protein
MNLEGPAMKAPLTKGIKKTMNVPGIISRLPITINMLGSQISFIGIIETATERRMPAINERIGLLP